MAGRLAWGTLTKYGPTFRIQVLLVVGDDDDDDNDDVKPGTVPPESCFFGQMLNIGALLLVITVFIR